MVKEILTLDKMSLDIAEDIDTKKENVLVRQIVVDLKDTIRENKLKALSAPQIGYNKRIFVINFNGDLRSFVNPVVCDYKGFTLSKETCSSIPGKQYIIPRGNKIEVMYTTPMGNVESRTLLGAAAVIYQHHLEHLIGSTIADIGLEIDDDFNNAPEEEQAEVIRAYMDALDIKEKTLKDDISKDAEAKNVLDAVRFEQGVKDGSITVESMTKEEIEELKKAVEKENEESEGNPNKPYQDDKEINNG